MSKECVTHHHACDCREEKFKQLEQENAALRAALTGMVREFDFIKPLQQEKVVLEKARAALARKEAQP